MQDEKLKSMLDLKFIREHTDLVKDGIKAKREVDNVDEIISLDERRRGFIQEGEVLKAKRRLKSPGRSET